MLPPRDVVSFLEDQSKLSRGNIAVTYKHYCFYISEEGDETIYFYTKLATIYFPLSLLLVASNESLVTNKI